MENAWFPPAQPGPGDTQERVYLRLAALHALNAPPRDPRFWNPKREAGWDNSSPTFQRYIPQHGVPKAFGCIGQSEEHVRRPTAAPRADFVPTRLGFPQRTSPLISYNSLGWNRRNFEPMPEVPPRLTQRQQAAMLRASTPNPSSGRPFGPPNSRNSSQGSIGSERPHSRFTPSFEPPRISGIGKRCEHILAFVSRHSHAGPPC